MDLFLPEEGYQPLAVRLRPQKLDEVVGQEHLVGKDSLLRRAILEDRLTSVIFYGPPGTGKTTLALVIAKTTKSRFVSLNAVLSGVKELKEVLDQAQQVRRYQQQRTLLFVDEVHRWNKAQQDALLPWVEDGTVILIGATTANPYFELNQALLSRSRVYEVKPLSEADLAVLVDRALRDPVRGYGQWSIELSEGARQILIEAAQGDARQLYQTLELLLEPHLNNKEAGARIDVSERDMAAIVGRPLLRYDKGGDAHYDVASAFIKSIRGSDPDAAVYWLGVMLEAGEDPSFIWRRLLISACEDVGLADPEALVHVQAAAEAFDRVGLPEGRYHLSFSVLRLALAPKSNSTQALFKVLDHLKQKGADEVPNHLKDSSRDSKQLGHGKGYLYPHDFEGHWVAQQYLPNNIKDMKFYLRGNLGWEKNNS
jgi:putative ATPase